MPARLSTHCPASGLVSNTAASARAGTGGAPCLESTSTGMARSVLTEISQLLNNLSERGESASISLRGLPMTGADRTQLDELLGRGEVRAELDLSGISEVWETRYPGVWWIRHQGLDGKIACEEIAVTPIPDILKTHPGDIRAAATRLADELAQAGESPNQQNRNETPDTEMPNVQ